MHCRYEGELQPMLEQRLPQFVAGQQHPGGVLYSILQVGAGGVKGFTSGSRVRVRVRLVSG